MDNYLMFEKLSKLPENLKAEVNDFIDFLLMKKDKKDNSKKPKFGSGKGMFVMQQDFDAPLNDMNEYMQ